MTNPTYPSQNQETDKEPPLAHLHPHKIMMYFCIVSLSMLFLAFSVAYLMTKGDWEWAQFAFPKAFLFSTIALGLSSYTMFKVLQCYETDDAVQLSKMLKYTIQLSLVFILLQIIGWAMLYNTGIYLSGKPDGSYLYLLTGLHILHVLAGGFFLYYVYKKSTEYLGDPVKQLLFFSDPTQKRRLELLSTYWHFVDILWIYLLLFFLLNHL